MTVMLSYVIFGGLHIMVPLDDQNCYFPFLSADRQNLGGMEFLPGNLRQCDGESWEGLICVHHLLVGEQQALSLQNADGIYGSAPSHRAEAHSVVLRFAQGGGLLGWRLES